jgi:uncharacterized protein YlxP (DUF503 family)
MAEQGFFIRLLTIELLIPHAQSLKDKRSGLRGLKQRISSRFNASVAEVGYQDKWQRAVLAVCLVGGNKRHLEANGTKIQTLCLKAPDIEVVAIEQQWL